MACDWRADAAAVCTDGGAGQRGGARVGIRGRGSVVAFELRHADGGLREGRRPAVGTAEATVSVAARLCTRATAKEIWRRTGRWDRCATRAFVGQRVEP